MVHQSYCPEMYDKLNLESPSIIVFIHGLTLLAYMLMFFSSLNIFNYVNALFVHICHFAAEGAFECICLTVLNALYIPGQVCKMFGFIIIKCSKKISCQSSKRTVN